MWRRAPSSDRPTRYMCRWWFLFLLCPCLVCTSKDSSCAVQFDVDVGCTSLPPHPIAHGDEQQQQHARNASPHSHSRTPHITQSNMEAIDACECARIHDIFPFHLAPFRCVSLLSLCSLREAQARASRSFVRPFARSSRCHLSFISGAACGVSFLSRVRPSGVNAHTVHVRTARRTARLI